MSKQGELFTEELARRNPDWEKIVAAHNDALAAERERADNATALLSLARDQPDTVWTLKQQLAAERENTHQALELLRKEAEAGARASEIIDHLEQQLAAEREQGVKALMERSFELHECQKQLAAEREKTMRMLESRDLWKQWCVNAQDQNQPLREQLAAAVEALKRCRQGFIAWNDPQHTNLIDAALAKVKEGK